MSSVCAPQPKPDPNQPKRPKERPRVTAGPKRMGRVMSIAEITGLEGDIIQIQEIYKFVRTGTAPDGAVQGHFQATGVRPRFLGDLIAQGIKIPGAYFDPSQPL